MSERPLVERILKPRPEFFLDLTDQSSGTVFTETSRLLRERALPEDTLFVRSPFGKYSPHQLEDVLGLSQEFISIAFANAGKMDAARSLGRIHLEVFRGIGHTLLPQSFGGRSWTMLLSVWLSTRLGDGKAVYTQGEGWSFTQRKGAYEDVSHFVVVKK